MAGMERVGHDDGDSYGVNPHVDLADLQVTTGLHRCVAEVDAGRLFELRGLGVKGPPTNGWPGNRDKKASVGEHPIETPAQGRHRDRAAGSHLPTRRRFAIKSKALRGPAFLLPRQKRPAFPATDSNPMKNKHIIHAALLISLAAFAPSAFSEDAVADKAKTEEKAAVQSGSLTAMIRDSATFSILSKALVAAGLDVTLGTKGEYTIFAPTDDAFGKLPEGALAKLLLPENKEKLRSLLLYHVVAGKLLASDLKEGEVKTMNGEKIEVDVDATEIKIDGSKIFSADVTANNGVMHSIGTVLVPESLENFAGLDH